MTFPPPSDGDAEDRNDAPYDDNASSDNSGGVDDASSTNEWTDRDIVLNYFPATHERLVPKPKAYALVEAGDGVVFVRDRNGEEVARLSIVTPSGNPTGELCCDLCQRTGTRRFLGLYRAELPGSQGRRFRYLTACRDRRACETRRIDDEGILTLLSRTTR